MDIWHRSRNELWATISEWCYKKAWPTASLEIEAEELHIDLSPYIGSLAKRNVYTFKDEYYRVDGFHIEDKYYHVLEWAETVDEVVKNVMDDIDPFPYDLTDEELMRELKNELEIV